MARALHPLCLLAVGAGLQACVAPPDDTGPGSAGDSGDADAPPLIAVGDLLTVPAGSFTMGGPGDDARASPEHLVTLSRGVELGRAEVNNVQLAAMLNLALEGGLLGGDYAGNVTVTNSMGTERELVDLDGAGSTGDNRCRVQFDGARFVVQPGWEQHPATWITWFGAAVFCNLLSEQEGLEPLYDLEDWSGITYGASGFRLPTEAEWERAARYDDQRSWPWGDAPAPDDTVANYDFHLDHTAPTCSYPAGDSALGLCDMAGNALEWTQDRHAPYGEQAVTDPVGENEDGRRVIRGGSWNHEAERLISWDRYYDPLPSEAYGGIGFRLARVGG